MFFYQLTIHQKISLRGNRIIDNGRQYVSSLGGYFTIPVYYREMNPSKGNLELINHLALNRKHKVSIETLEWLYGTKGKTVDHVAYEFDKKANKRLPKVVGKTVFPDTAGLYGFGGVPSWSKNLSASAVQKKTSTTIQTSLF